MLLRKARVASLTLAIAGDADAGLIDYARRRFPDHFGKELDDPIRRLIGEVRASAWQRGIFEQSDVVKAFDLTVMYGPDFYDAQWARGVFATRGLSTPQQLDIVCEHVRHHVPGF